MFKARYLRGYKTPRNAKQNKVDYRINLTLSKIDLIIGVNFRIRVLNLTTTADIPGPPTIQSPIVPPVGPTPPDLGKYIDSIDVT